MNNRIRRVLAAVAVSSLLVGGAAAVSAESQAVPLSSNDVAAKAQPFPHMYSNVRWMPLKDANGKPDPINVIVWRQATVLTHAQTVALIESGALPVVGGVHLPPWSGLARTTNELVQRPDARRTISNGGCLALFWDPVQKHRLPDGRLLGTGAQYWTRAGCHA